MYKSGPTFAIAEITINSTSREADESEGRGKEAAGAGGRARITPDLDRMKTSPEPPKKEENEECSGEPFMNN